MILMLRSLDSQGSPWTGPTQKHHLRAFLTCPPDFGSRQPEYPRPTSGLQFRASS
jgi:hypothetical protein